MSKRATLLFWSCVGGVQLLGFVLDFIGCNLDDPVRLFGLILLEPGMSVIWDWVPRHVTTRGQYEGALAIAVAINLSVAALVFYVCVFLRVILQKRQKSN